jgi:putative ABC transport system permease protein
MIKDYFKIAIRNLRRRKIRSWLTLLGIFISIAIIFILISLSVGLQEAVKDQFKQLGADKFFIVPGAQINAPGTSSTIRITSEDVEVIKKIAGVKKVMAWATGNAKIEFKDEVRFRYVFGIKPEDLQVFIDTGSFKIAEGINLRKGDSEKVILGYDYGAGRMFNEKVSIRDKIKINDKEFRVNGLLERVGNSDDDKNMFISLEDYKNLFGDEDKFDYIIVQINNEDEMKEVSDNVKRKLMKFREVDEDTIDFTVLTPEELLGTFGSILNIVMAFLVGVASISLIVGGLGIATTMYTSVLERFKEIGVMKAIGARNPDILVIFIIEAGLLGAIGGLIGVGVGIGVSKSIEFIAINYFGTTLLKAASPLWLIVSCVDFAFLVGVLSGILPAKHASKIKPVDALRYE